MSDLIVSRYIIARLDVVDAPSELDLPGYGLHPLKGKLKGFWAIRVSGNWRIIFRFKDGDAFDVNLIDYHYERSYKHGNEKSTTSRTFNKGCVS